MEKINWTSARIQILQDRNEVDQVTKILSKNSKAKLSSNHVVGIQSSKHGG